MDALATHLPPTMQGCSESAGGFWSANAAWWEWFLCGSYGASSSVSASARQHPAREAERLCSLFTRSSAFPCIVSFLSAKNTLAVICAFKAS